MSRKTNLVRVGAPLAIFVAALITRLVIISPTPTEWDSVQFVFGVSHFDLYENSPHPPGYWLYIAMGRLVEWISPLNAEYALSLVSALASAGSVALAWQLGKRIRGPLLGLTFAALIGALPFDWFYGSIPAVYSFDVLGGLLFLNVALRETITVRSVVLSAIALGLLTGSRQSELSVFSPLMLFIVWRSNNRWRSLLWGGVAGFVTILIWVIPAGIDQPGGLKALWNLSRMMWTNAANQTSFFSGAPAAAVRFNIGRATSAAVVAILFAIPVGVATWMTSAMRAARTTERAVPTSRLVIVALISAIPGVLITVFGYYGKPGYVLAFIPGLLMLLIVPLVLLRRSIYVMGCVLLLVVAGIWSDQFLKHDGIFPTSWQNKSALWFTQTRYGTPYRDNTRFGINGVNGDAQQYKPLEAFTRSDDTLVYEGQEGVFRFRQQSYLFENRVAEVTNIGTAYCQMAYAGKIADCPQNVIEVRPGGRAVFVANAPTPGVQALADAGIAQRITLPTGPTAFAVPIGTTVDGLTVEANAKLVPGIESHRLLVTP